MSTKNLGLKLIAGSLFTLITMTASAVEINRVAKPVRVIDKPDLIVYMVDEFYAQDDKIVVTVRNIGKAQSDSAVLKVTRMDSNAFSEGSIITLKPDGIYNIPVKFASKLKKGERLKIEVDSKNHVNESNEQNNSVIRSY